MLVPKASVVAMLLEVGEENVAVLLARSTLPDMLDTDRDLDVLATYGLESDRVVQVVTSAVEAVAANEDDVEHGARLDRTVSVRWADLVDDWVAAGARNSSAQSTCESEG